MTAFHGEANRYEQQAETYQERIAEFEAKLEPLDRTVADLTDRMVSLEQRLLEPQCDPTLIFDNSVVIALSCWVWRARQLLGMALPDVLPAVQFDSTPWQRH